MPGVDTVLGLKCIRCGKEYAKEFRRACSACHGLLKVEYDSAQLKRIERSSLCGDTLWRYHKFLPIAELDHFVSLGEGMTPLLRCPNLGRALEMPALYVKFDGVNPTGTVKDRSSVTAIGAALEFGFTICGVVSTGNAGSSIASYATRAGLRCLILSADTGAAPKMSHMEACSTDLFYYKGTYDEVVPLFDQLVEEGRICDCGATRNPYKPEGKKTIALEVCEQMGWNVPDYLILPGAMFEIFISNWRCLTLLAEIGWIDRIPTLILAQSSHANPVSKAFKESTDIVPQKIGYTVAEGLAVGDPGPKGEWALRILRESGGLAEDVTDEEIIAAQSLLAGSEGIWAGPTGVSTVAVLMKLLEKETLPRNASVVCLVTETGLKGEYPPKKREGVAPTLDAIRGFLTR